MKLIVDTNRIIAALVKDSFCRHIITHLNAELLTIYFSTKELAQHKALILEKSELSETDLELLLDKLVSKMTILDDRIVNQQMARAKKIMDSTDPNDTPFIAAALATGADIWSDDTHFEKQKVVKIWRTKDIANLL